jgi:hypothetical protein
MVFHAFINRKHGIPCLAQPSEQKFTKNFQSMDFHDFYFWKHGKPVFQKHGKPWLNHGYPHFEPDWQVPIHLSHHYLRICPYLFLWLCPVRPNLTSFVWHFIFRTGKKSKYYNGLAIKYACLKHDSGFKWNFIAIVNFFVSSFIFHLYKFYNPVFNCMRVGGRIRVYLPTCLLTSCWIIFLIDHLNSIILLCLFAFN